ncbi:MAG: MFS transporter [Plectolyngbya sp. WJT66-NPBG17]|jgi:MFS family permease|nr:MFS transporter [Plectolyngbya sp. WJT66-NPBG17]
MSEGRDPFAALRYKDYRFYAIALFLSVMGFRMQSVAIGWELYERTSNAFILGLVGLVQVLPVIILTLPAGHVADRYDRKHTVLYTQVMLALCSVGLAVISFRQGSIEWIFALLFLNGVARAFSFPANEALQPQLIPLEVFGNAATWHSSSFQLASVLGPALGGLLIAIQNSATTVYITDAVLGLIGFGLIALITTRSPIRVKEPPSVRALLGGIEFVRKNPVIFSAIALDLFAVLLGGAVALLPIFAKDILQVGPVGLGWLRAAPSGGAVLMSAPLAHLPLLKQAGKTLLWSVVGFGVVTIIFGLSQSFWLSLLMLALSGAFDNVSVVVRRTLVQVWTPDDLRGRVSAVSSLFISGSNELGDFESGSIAALFGPIFAVVSGGIGTIAVVSAIAFFSPQLRRLGSLQKAEVAHH